jgi:hypothetical protein
MYGSFTLAPFSNSEIQNDTKRLQPLKLVGLDTPSFITRICIEILVSVLKTVFNFGLSQNTFPNFRKQVAIVPVWIKADTDSYF